MDSVGCEAELQDQLLWCFLNPLQIAASKSFVCGRMRRDVEGLPANSGRPDFLLLSGDRNTVLVAVEVKTSAALWVPPGRSLPDVYAEAGKNSKIVKAVHQLYSYLDRVPYGVLLTDKQLFCMRREHDELLCSPSIPLTAEQGEAAAGGFGAGSLTAAAALYCTLRPDPQVPGHTPRRLAESSSAVVLQGELGGRAAAVKMVDLWQGSEGKKLLQHEARMYQALQPLQGSYVPRLLGYGSCDGWQFFVATSLEGPSLNLEDGWALGEAATRAGALAALDAVGDGQADWAGAASSCSRSCLARSSGSPITAATAYRVRQCEACKKLTGGRPKEEVVVGWGSWAFQGGKGGSPISVRGGRAPTGRLIKLLRECYAKHVFIIDEYKTSKNRDVSAANVIRVLLLLKLMGFERPTKLQRPPWPPAAAGPG
eukprot:XP_001700971.1 predicted protein [Chlamydomonas reinhardtii]